MTAFSTGGRYNLVIGDYRREIRRGGDVSGGLNELGCESFSIEAEEWFDFKEDFEENLSQIWIFGGYWIC